MSTPATTEEPDDRSKGTETTSKSGGVSVSKLKAKAAELTPEQQAVILKRAQESVLNQNPLAIVPTVSPSVQSLVERYTRIQEQVEPIRRIFEAQKRIDESLAPVRQMLKTQEAMREAYSMVTGAAAISKALSDIRPYDSEAIRAAVRMSEVLGTSLRVPTETERIATLIGQSAIGTNSTAAYEELQRIATARRGAVEMLGGSSLTANGTLRKNLEATWNRLGLESAPDERFGTEIEKEESKFIIPNDGKIEAVVSGGSPRIQFASARVIELMQLIASDPKARFLLSGRELEELWAEALDRLGYEDVELTSQSGDYGIDVYATQRVAFGKMRMGFQCKAYQESAKIELQPIQAIYGAVDMENLGVGVLVTTTRFAPVSERWAGESFGRVQLVNGDELASIVRQVAELN